jgi:hypothetical protein
MFDFFKRRRQQEKWLLQATKIGTIHQRMTSEVPAAAYLFARTLYNARDVLDDSSMTLARKIAHIDEEIQTSIPLSNADAGIGVIALRFTRMLLASQEHIDVGSFALSAAFGEIAPRGAQYREVDERDERSPTNEDARGILTKRGHECLAGLVQTVRAEVVSAGQNAAFANDDVWSLIAMFDLREEASSGRLAPFMRALEGSMS